MGNTKQIKTAKEIMLQFANEHSYESWGELMYDTHEPVQVDYTKQVMELYHAQYQHPVPAGQYMFSEETVKNICKMFVPENSTINNLQEVIDSFKTAPHPHSLTGNELIIKM